MRIYIVLHHEIMGTRKNYRCDEMVFFTCSSMKRAFGLIKSANVCRWSWWEIQVHDCEWPEHVGYYGLRGGKLAKPPYDKCVEFFKAWSEKNNFET
jgi:hypothetical protein